MAKIVFPKGKIKDTYHRYWCENCEFKFGSMKAICPACKSTNVVIDEPIIRLKK